MPRKTVFHVLRGIFFCVLTVQEKKHGDKSMDIFLNSEIGSGNATSAALSEQLALVKDGEDVRIVVNSPGGDCFEGVAVYNTLREFARGHKGAVTTYIQGMAASAASWIALAASAADTKNRVIVEDNSVFMIHNCWGAVVGDRRDMVKTAALSAKIDGLMAEMLARKSGKSAGEIAAMMDEETWLFGSEIVDAGFADEVIGGGKKEEEKGVKDSFLSEARKRLSDCRKSMKENAKSEMAGIKAAFAAVADISQAEKAKALKAEAEKKSAERLRRAREAFSSSL